MLSNCFSYIYKHNFKKHPDTSEIVYIINFLLLVSFLNAQTLVQKKYNIAVLHLYGNNVSEGDLGGLSNRLRTELFKTGKFNVIERSRVEEILKEQGFQQTGCTNNDCAVEIGQLIGVEKIVLGSVDKVGTIYTADIRLVDVGSGKIDNMATADCEDCNINDVLITSIQYVANKLAGVEIEETIKTKPETQTPVNNKIRAFGDKNFYICPKIGIGTISTGGVGVEFQLKDVGWNIGYNYLIEDNWFHGGIRYYFKPFQNSYYLGVGGVYSNRKAIKPDDQKTRINYAAGISLGHCWRRKAGWDLSFGLGAIVSIRTIEYYNVLKEDSIRYDYFPMLELTFGYSF